MMLLLLAHTALAQDSSFTYQGKLTDGGSPATGTYELEFKLFDAASGGTQQPQPSPVTLQFTGAQAVAVNNGVFTVQLDFGANAFPGAARYLEIGVRHVGKTAFNTLSPRQPIAATPYAIRSISSTTAVNFSGNLSGDVTGTQLATVVSSVGGTLNFLAGKSSKSFAVPVIDDVYVEGPEALTLTLSNPVGAVADGSTRDQPAVLQQSLCGGRLFCLPQKRP